MGSGILPSLWNLPVALDADFMIQYLQEIKIGETSVYITTTHVALLMVSCLILIFAVFANRVITKADPEETPGTFQNIVEIIVEMLGNMVDGLMGTNARRFVNYISSIFIFLLVSNVSGLLGLRPPTADYGVTLPLALFTFCIIHYCGIKKNKSKHFTNLFQPVALLFPINVISEIATPLSLSVRLFGNIMSGTVLMGLVYGLFPIFCKLGIPAVMHIYFDIFSGCIQAYVFCMLTMVYVNDKIAD